LWVTLTDVSEILRNVKFVGHGDGVCAAETHGEERCLRDQCRTAAWMMRDGPSGSAFRSGSQTSPSCCGRRAVVVNVG
jgi:hypothetical protein